MVSEVWKTIKPVQTKYRRNDRATTKRMYYTLEPGLWTTILVDRISKHRMKIICTWSFKRSKVYLNGEWYIRVFATCTTCKATLNGGVRKIPSANSDVKFTFIVSNFKPNKHDGHRKNVRIGGQRAKELFSSTDKASVIKRRIINESGVQIIEPPKGRDISENAIRAGQSRTKQAKKLSPSPLQALEYLKATKAFGPSMHMTGLSPFFAIYGSPNQFALFKSYSQRNAYTKITCDATGGIVHKLGK